MTELIVKKSLVIDFLLLQAQWQRLENQIKPKRFLSWDWIGRWAQLCQKPVWQVAVYEGEKLIGLALFCQHLETRRKILRVRQWRLHETGNPEQDVLTIEYNNFLARSQDLPRIWAAVLSAFEQESDWDELVIGGADSALEALLQQQGKTVIRRAQTVAFVVDLAALRAKSVQDIDGYLALLGRSTRSQIRRSIRKYQARGALELVAARTPEEAQAFLQRLAVFHQKRWEAKGHKGAFAWPFYVQFHQQMIAQALERDAVELLELRVGGEPIAGLYNLLTEDWAGYYLGGFAFESDPHLKPGLVAHIFAVLHHLSSMRQSYDFMGGENRYKRNLGQETTEILSLSLARHRPFTHPLLAAEQSLKRFLYHHDM